MLIAGFSHETGAVLAESTGQLITITASDTAHPVVHVEDHPDAKALIAALRHAERDIDSPRTWRIHSMSPADPLTEFFAWETGGDICTKPVALNTFRTAAVRGDETPDVHPEPRPVEDRDTALPNFGDRFTRPNGETYLARSLVSHDDVTVLRTCRDNRLNVVLYGGPGTGKTALAEVAHPDLVTIQCHGDMTVAQIVGQLMPTHDGGWRFVPGPLTIAMTEGRALLLDEINKIPAEVIAVLHAATDGRGVIRLDDRPDDPLVHAADGFTVVGTLNPDDLGSKGLPEAITSRFPINIHIATDLDAARTLDVPEQFLTLVENLHTHNSQHPTMPPVWAPAMRELLAAKATIQAGLGVEFAARALLGQCPTPEDLPILAEKMQLVFGIDDLAPLELGSHC